MGSVVMIIGRNKRTRSLSGQVFEVLPFQFWIQTESWRLLRLTFTHSPWLLRLQIIILSYHNPLAQLLLHAYIFTHEILTNFKKIQIFVQQHEKFRRYQRVNIILCTNYCQCVIWNTKIFSMRLRGFRCQIYRSLLTNVVLCFLKKWNSFFTFS